MVDITDYNLLFYSATSARRKTRKEEGERKEDEVEVS